MSELDQCLRALEQIGMQRIRKSMTDGRPRSAKIMKALAVAEATKTPAGAVLARRILQLERQETLRKSFAPVIKSMGLSASDDDEWSRLFKSVDDDDADEEDELRRELRDLADRESEITRRIRELHGRGR